MNGIVKQTTREHLLARRFCHSVAGIMISLQLWGAAGTQAANYRDALEPSSGLHPPRGNSEAFTARTTDQSKNAWGTPFAVAQKKSTRIVTTTADSGPGSLRQAISEAQNGDIISFDPTLTNGGPAIITLTNGAIAITNDITIDGPELLWLAISGNNAFQVLRIGESATVMLKNLMIHNGAALDGGGVYNAGTVIVENCTLAENNSWGSGGGSA